MNIVYNIIAAIVCLIIGYLIGSISMSIVIGKTVYHQDPRDYGSKNAGGTNAGRIWGRGTGLLVIILDMAKTIIPFWAVWAMLAFIPVADGLPLMASAKEIINGDSAAYIIQWPVYWLTLLGACVGHIYPIYYNFRGGKGVSIFLGGLAGSNWPLFILSGTAFLLSLKAKKYVSLGSIVSAVTAVVISWVFAILILCHVIPGNWAMFGSYGPIMLPNYVYAIVVTIMALLLIAAHRENIKRIRQGAERKITWM